MTPIIAWFSNYFPFFQSGVFLPYYEPCCHEPVLKKRKRKEIRIGDGYQAEIPMQVSDQVPVTETDYYKMPPCRPPGLPQPICHKLPNSNPNSHWKSNGQHSTFQPVKNNNNQQKPQQTNKYPQSDSSNYLKASQASASTSIASLSPHQSRLQKTFKIG